MMHILYDIIIYPVYWLIRFAFVVLYRLFGNSGAAIIGVSILVSLLTLPLYNRAEAVQEEERKKRAEVEPWIKHIKKTFHGDEKYMMLMACYNSMDYHPAYALKSSLSLALQLPFFIAAYSYLSNLTMLDGTSFLFIENLGTPDHLIKLEYLSSVLPPALTTFLQAHGYASVNLLPFVMTGINMLSGYIYTKGYALKDKIQLYALALIFLVLLYKSPSGLVLYWTMNNIFSLGKNIVTKKIRKKGKEPKKEDTVFDRSMFMYYLIGALLFFVLMGILIPSSVIVASPEEFVSLTEYHNPLGFVFSTACFYFGAFAAWGSLIFYLLKDKQRKWMAAGIWIISIPAIFNYMFFGKDFGILSPYLQFDNEPHYYKIHILKNTLPLVIITIIMILIWIKWRKAVSWIYTIVIISLVVMSAVNIIRTEKVLLDSHTREKVIAKQSEQLENIIHLSTKGKNVVVFMLDRAVSGFVPYIFNEKPELKESFTGFTYYPNTISHGGHTNYGAPGLFGGYDYTPDKMNERPNESLVSKHDEALKVLPAVFSENGYHVSVVDPPYAGYTWEADLTIYDDIDNVETHAAEGVYQSIEEEYYGDVQEDYFIGYSIFKVLPVCIQEAQYDEGYYNTEAEKEAHASKFAQYYAVLKNLYRLTEIKDDDSDNLLVMDNDATHEPIVLQLPEYEPVKKVDNTGLETGYRTAPDGEKILLEDERQMSHYHGNMAALIQMAAWLDYLKEQGVYDNTRIIIVADHGYGLELFQNMIMNDIAIDDESFDVSSINPLLMVKDFDSRGELKQSDDFMTNADVPTIATSGIIKDPVNPYTGNRINEDEKDAHPQYVTNSHNWSTSTNGGNVFDTSDGDWYSVHDNIFDKSCWKCLGKSIK